MRCGGSPIRQNRKSTTATGALRLPVDAERRRRAFADRRDKAGYLRHLEARAGVSGPFQQGAARTPVPGSLAARTACVPSPTKWHSTNQTTHFASQLTATDGQHRPGGRGRTFPPSKETVRSHPGAGLPPIDPKIRPPGRDQDAERGFPETRPGAHKSREAPLQRDTGPSAPLPGLCVCAMKFQPPPDYQCQPGRCATARAYISRSTSHAVLTIASNGHIVRGKDG
jgi:hypothetical protein